MTEFWPYLVFSFTGLGCLFYVLLPTCFLFCSLVVLKALLSWYYFVLLVVLECCFRLIAVSLGVLEVYCSLVLCSHLSYLGTAFVWCITALICRSLRCLLWVWYYCLHLVSCLYGAAFCLVSLSVLSRCSCWVLLSAGILWFIAGFGLEVCASGSVLTAFTCCGFGL